MVRPSILMIYTGGTIGMSYDRDTNALKPLEFDRLMDQIPEIRGLEIDIEVESFQTPIDSSNVTVSHWKEIALIIEKNYLNFDGFVILHGSDTMAFSASALSFMLENLAKPVIFTGSQLPIGQIRTDGKENLITALEIASNIDDGIPRIPEVAILFEDALYRANRTRKRNTEYFEAFESPNFSPLAKVGININYRDNHVLPIPKGEFKVNAESDQNVQVSHLFPGMTKSAMGCITSNPNLRGLVLLTYGAGNTTTQSWFLDELNTLIENGVIILNITQCEKGTVRQGLYETSSAFNEMGIISGYDMTFEAGITKLMNLLGRGLPSSDIKRLLTNNICGEITI